MRYLFISKTFVYIFKQIETLKLHITVSIIIKSKTLEYSYNLINKMSESRKFKDKILNIFTTDDLFHKAFLRPLEVILRTKQADPSYY